MFAKRGLFELNHLMPGKLAPEPPAGAVDLAGKPAKLSDYRGRVVVLDFWLVNCPPCRKLLPHSRALVSKYAGRPFALIGVGGDTDRGECERFLKQQPQPWTQWWGGADDGGMARQWNMSPFPTLVVIDDRGVIRKKVRVGNAEGDLATLAHDLDVTVAGLVREAENRKK